MRTTGTLSLILLLALSVSVEAKRPKNGKYFERWPDGKTKTEGYYKDGVRDGYWTWYHRNGKVKAKVRYIKARKQGVEEKFNDEGKLLARTEWRAGQRHGDHISQFWVKEDGELVLRSKTTGRYYLGKKDGAWTTEWSDGTVQRVKYHRGKRAD